MIKNRKIKFRVWDIKNKIMTSSIKTNKDIGYVDFDIKTDGEITREILNINCCSLDRTTTENQDNYIVQQCTGFMDANDREIFEGDIIDWTAYHAIGKVIYNDVTGSFYWTGSETELWTIDKKEILIVGNIFENSELLKNDKTANS